ncbi:Copper-transporting ATPase ccc2 [Dirofilaria immitis]
MDRNVKVYKPPDTSTIVQATFHLKAFVIYLPFWKSFYHYWKRKKFHLRVLLHFISTRKYKALKLHIILFFRRHYDDIR